MLEHRAAVALVFEHGGGRVRRGGKAGRDGGRRHHAAERVDHGQDGRAQAVEPGAPPPDIERAAPETVFAVKTLQNILEKLTWHGELIERPALDPGVDGEGV